MTTTGPVDVFVDCDELDRLRSELEALSQELSWVENDLAYPDDAFGGADVHEAVEAFTASWRSVRTELSAALAAAASFVRGAIEAYQESETLLRSAASGATT